MKQILFILTGIVGLLLTNCGQENSSNNEDAHSITDSIAKTDPFLLDDINPEHDFISVVEGDTVYFRIREDSISAAMVYWRRSNFNNHVIHIPSVVIDRGKSYVVKEIGPEAMGVAFYGDREGHSIWFTDSHQIDTVYVPASIRNISGTAFSARFRSKSMHIMLTDSIEYLGVINCFDIRDKDDAIILPANLIEVGYLKDNEEHETGDFRFSKLYIPEHVEYLGGLERYERNQPLFKTVEVHPRNKHYRTIDGVLFNYDLTELHWATVNENLYIPKSVCVDKDIISDMEANDWYPHIQMPRFKSIKTEPGNPYCVAIDDVLYDIKNKCMIMSTDNPKRIAHVPSWCNSVWLLEGYWHKPTKYVFSNNARQGDVDSFIAALKKYTYDEDDNVYQFSYKGKIWTNKDDRITR